MRGFITAGAFAIVLMTTGAAAWAEGGGDSNAYVYQTMQQTRAHNYSTQFDQTGLGTPRGSLER